MRNRSEHLTFRSILFAFFCFGLMNSVLLAGCTRNSSNQNGSGTETGKSADLFEPITAAVKKSDQFGNVYINLQEIDLEYGDSVNLSFSGGYRIDSVPFYPEFYGTLDAVVLTDYYDDLIIAGIGCSFNKRAKIEKGETLSITLDERGKYQEEFEAYNIDPDLVKWEGQSDEAFRNAREITTGRISEGILYRGSSPFQKKFSRIELMSSFLQENDIQCILNLSDSDEVLSQLAEILPEHTAEMLAGGKVIPCPLGMDFSDPETMKTLADGLTAMTEKEGPYLIHCSLGRDRTGVVSALLEALCGASYDELVADYMESYRNLHDIDMDPDSTRYRLFRQRLDENLEKTMLISRDLLAESDLESAAEDYFIRCGMTPEQIEQLRKVLTAPRR